MGENNKFQGQVSNPGKATSRVTINAFMMGNLFFIFTIIWTLSPEKFSYIVIAQLVLAIPLFLISSLSYAKVGYWKKNRAFDTFGWLSNTIGNILVLNVIGIMISTTYRSISWMFFALVIVVILIYYSIAVYYDPSKLKSRALKLLLFLVILFFGGIYPLIV